MFSFDGNLDLSTAKSNLTLAARPRAKTKALVFEATTQSTTKTERPTPANVHRAGPAPIAKTKSTSVIPDPAKTEEPVISTPTASASIANARHAGKGSFVKTMLTSAPAFLVFIS